MTSEAEDRVDAIETTSGHVLARITTGSRPRAVAFTPDGKRAYVTNELGGSVTSIDAEENRLSSTIDLGSTDDGLLRARPMGIAIAPDGRRAYVTTGRGGTVAVIDTSTDAVVAVIGQVGPRPWGIAITRDGKKLYVANGPSNDVAVIETSSLTVVRRVRVGEAPWGVCTGPS